MSEASGACAVTDDVIIQTTTIAIAATLVERAAVSCRGMERHSTTHPREDLDSRWDRRER